MSHHHFDLGPIGSGLVVAGHQEAIEAAVASGACVITAPPGTGKTTFVPPLVSNLVRDRGVTILTQPRRVAVRAATARIAALDGSRVGATVGYTVRGDRSVSADTRLEVLTPGVLLRRLLSDPGLSGVGAVILDEVHERSLDSDLLLGMIAEVRSLREDLLVIAMSATLDATRVAELLGAGAGAVPVVNIPSALHSLREIFVPFSGGRLDERGVTKAYLSHLASITLNTRAAEDCDALVFVPGAREVDELARLLTEEQGERLEVLPLHGRVSARDQDRAVRGRSPNDPHRIVVSTSLAESSLTVPGVRLVVDSGLSREVRRDQLRGITGLVTVSASRASAIQRGGRAARQGPGLVVRAYSEAEFAHMPAASSPEIASADLTDGALLLAAWGTPGGVGIALPSPPPEAAMREATAELRALHLTDDSGHLTAEGHRVSRLPVGVREARALLAGAHELDNTQAAAEIVAALSDEYRDPGAELPRLLRNLKLGRATASDRWRAETRRLTRLISAESGTPVAAAVPAHSVAHDNDNSRSPQEAIGAVLALTRPEWIARRVSENSRSYLLAGGGRAALPEKSNLLASEWIAISAMQRASGRVADGTGTVIRMAAPLTKADALRLGDVLLTRDRAATVNDGRVRVREEQRLGAILLASTPASPTDADTGPAFAAHIRERGLTALHWSESATRLRARLTLLVRELGKPWPSIDDEALIEQIDHWLGPDLKALSANASLSHIDVATALRRLLPWPEAARLDKLAPERLTVPSGATTSINYPSPDDSAASPFIAVKLQEMFGLAQTPRLVGGTVPVLVHLLSPARRPLAVTDDLASFWNGPYQEVRREMRGRYPKHPWPEDPWAAQATARTSHPHRRQ